MTLAGSQPVSRSAPFIAVKVPDIRTPGKINPVALARRIVVYPRVTVRPILCSHFPWRGDDERRSAPHGRV